MKKINFGKLSIDNDVISSIQECIENNWVTMGPKVKEFEKKWNTIFNYKYSAAVSSGTDAVLNLVSSLYDFGAKRGDEVIVPALSFIASTNAVLTAGFTPVFVDIRRDTLNINEDLIEAAITNKTRAILAVHTMGLPCNMNKILEIANKHNLIVFEDACEAHGATYTNNYGGPVYIGQESYGAAFSYYVAHLICTAEGGMVSTNSDTVYNSVVSTRSHGRIHDSLYFSHLRVGYNSKMNDMEAALGISSIKNFSDIFSKRKEVWYNLVNYTKQFTDLAYFSIEPEGYSVCPHGFSITLKDNKQVSNLTTILDKYNIEWKRNFGCIPTQHIAYEFMNHKLGEFPNAEYVGNHGVHIGTHAYMTEEDIATIKKALSECFE